MFLSYKKLLFSSLVASTKLNRIGSIGNSNILRNDISSRRFNGQIPWFIQKYHEEVKLNEDSVKNQKKNVSEASDQSDNVPDIKNAAPTVDAAISNITNGLIKYSDEIIVYSDPVEEVEDFDINDRILTNTKEIIEKFKLTLNYKDVTIINSKIKTSRDFFILLNSMDSKQHNDRILISLKQFIKKYQNPDFEITDISMVGYRQDYLSKKQRQRKERKLNANNGYINSRFHKKYGTDDKIGKLYKGKTKAWGMLSFMLNSGDKRFFFEIHVMSPLQRSLLNFEELYDVQGHYDSEELEHLMIDNVGTIDIVQAKEESDQSIFEGLSRR
ncbi:hypothetical protein QEN19_002521 [Hanseniaspora menglaensis]